MFFLAFIAALLHKMKDFVAFLHYVYVLFYIYGLMITERFKFC